MTPLTPQGERRAIAAAYFLYFATFGLYIPYFPAYLRGNGLSSLQIGALMAMGPLMRLLLPPVFGFVADRFRGPRFWGVVIGWTMVGGVIMLISAQSFFFLAAGVLVYYIGTASTIPLLDATALGHLKRNPAPFGQIRLWGSIGFIITSLGLGQLFPALQTTAIAAALLATHLVFAIFLSWSKVEEQSPEKPVFADLGPLLKNRTMQVLLVALLLNRVASSSYFGFYTLFVQDLGYSGRIVAWSWGIGVTVEVGVMILIDRVIDRFGAGRLLSLGLLLEAARWWVYTTEPSEAVLLLVAPGHGIAFACIYVSMIRILMHEVPDRLRATGQGIAFGATGLGQSLGLVMAGYLKDVSGPVAMFQFSGVVGLVAFAAAMIGAFGRYQIPNNR